MKTIYRLVGELAVIIVGILAALAADDWWTDRQERAAEFEILEAIDQDVAVTRESVESAIAEMDLALSSLRTLSEGSAGGAAALDDDTLAVLFVDGLWESAILTVQMSAYDEIKNSGRLKLIDDATLRRRLAEYDRRLALTMALFNDLFQNQQIKTDPYLIANVQLSQLFSTRADRRPEKPVRLDIVPEVQDLRPLLDDPVFLNQVAAKYYLMYEYQRFATGLLAVLEQLAGLVEARLGELNN